MFLTSLMTLNVFIVARLLHFCPDHHQTWTPDRYGKCKFNDKYRNHAVFPVLKTNTVLNFTLEQNAYKPRENESCDREKRKTN